MENIPRETYTAGYSIPKTIVYSGNNRISLCDNPSISDISIKPLLKKKNHFLIGHIIQERRSILRFKEFILL